MSDGRRRLEQAAHGFLVAGRGLVWTTEGVTRTVWLEAGKAIVAQHEGALWALGDWLVVALREGWDTLGWEVATTVTGYSRSHLGRAYNQAVAWPTEARTLPWSTLNQIRRLPAEERAAVVTRAVTKGWTHDDAFAFVEATVRPAPAAGVHDVVSRPLTAPTVDGRRRTREVTCPHCGKRFALRAAGIT
jgi:hypothetical protein